MKRITILFAVIIGLGVALSACSGGGEKAKEPAKQEVKKEAPPKEASPQDELAAQMKRAWSVLA